MVAFLCSINLRFLLLAFTILLALHSNVFFHHSNLALIYRPSTFSLPLFLEEFSVLTETVCILPLFFILGDFDISHNNKLNSYFLKLDNIFELFYLTQHANFPQ